MNDKRYKTLILLMVALLLISTGLFALQNYLASQNENDATLGNTSKEETIIIYRAIRDIPAYTPLTPNMFEAVTIPKIANVGFVHDINVILGTNARSYIYRGYFLTESSYSTENIEAGLIHSIEIRADFSGNLSYGDIVDVYAIANNGAVVPLFGSKRLYQQTGQSGSAVTRMYVKVTRNELINYYSMQGNHKIAVIPVDTNQVNLLPNQQEQYPEPNYPEPDYPEPQPEDNE